MTIDPENTVVVANPNEGDLVQESCAFAIGVCEFDLETRS